MGLPLRSQAQLYYRWQNPILTKSACFGRDVALRRPRRVPAAHRRKPLCTRFGSVPPAVRAVTSQRDVIYQWDVALRRPRRAPAAHRRKPLHPFWFCSARCTGGDIAARCHLPMGRRAATSAPRTSGASKETIVHRFGSVPPAARAMTSQRDVIYQWDGGDIAARCHLPNGARGGTSGPGRQAGRDISGRNVQGGNSAGFGDHELFERVRAEHLGRGPERQHPTGEPFER